MNGFLILGIALVVAWIAIILYEKYTLIRKLKNAKEALANKTIYYEQLRADLYKIQRNYLDLMKEHSRYMAEKESYKNIVDN